MLLDVIADYDVDARNRLWAWLELKNVTYRNQLKTSVDTAGAQLELLKPSLIDSNRDGIYAGPAVMASSGTVLIVLAHEKKVFTMHFIPASGHTLAYAIKNAVDYAKEALGVDVDKLSAGAIVPAIEDLVKKYGQAPGQKSDELTQEHAARILGILFATLPDAARIDTVLKLEAASAIGVCPVMIGLIGEGTETGLCAVWPLLLPLAPYADKVIKE